MKLTVTIVEGRNLVAKDRNIFGIRTSSDPFIKIVILDKVYGETKVQIKTRSPVWNETFAIDVHTDNDNHDKQTKQPLMMQSSIELTIWDCDQRTKDDPMGVVIIPWNDLILNSQYYRHLRWYPVQQGSQDKGHYCKRASGEILLVVSLDDENTRTSEQNINGNNVIPSTFVPPCTVEPPLPPIVKGLADVWDRRTITIHGQGGYVGCNEDDEICMKGDSSDAGRFIIERVKSMSSSSSSSFVSQQPKQPDEIPVSAVSFRIVGTYKYLTHSVENLEYESSSEGIARFGPGFHEGGGYNYCPMTASSSSSSSSSSSYNDSCYQQPTKMQLFTLENGCGGAGIGIRSMFGKYWRSSNWSRIISQSPRLLSDETFTFLLLDDESFGKLQQNTKEVDVTVSSVAHQQEEQDVVVSVSETFVQCTVEPDIVIGEVPIKSTTEQPNVLLTCNKKTYQQGESVVIQYSYTQAAAGIIQTEPDLIIIVPENAIKGEYYSSYVALKLISDDGGSSAGTKMITVNWKAGNYMAVLYMDGFKKLQAISDVFEVKQKSTLTAIRDAFGIEKETPTPGTLTTDQSSYELGNALVLSFWKPGCVPFREDDFLHVVPANATENEYISAKVTGSVLGGDCGSTSGTKQYMVLWRVPGKYKAVLFLKDGQVLAVSDVFEVRETTFALKSTQSLYYQGQLLEMEFYTTSWFSFHNIFISIVTENAIRSEFDNGHSSVYVAREKNVEEEGSTGGRKTTTTFRVDWKAGRYKAIMVLVSGQIVVESNVFEIMPLPVVLASKESSYHIGQNLVLEILNTINDPFRGSDYITIVPENATTIKEYDFLSVAYTNLGEDSGSTSVSKTIPISWAAGKYKAILFLNAQSVLAISNVFEVTN